MQPQVQAPCQVGVDPPPDPEPAAGQGPHGQAEHQRGRRGKAQLSQEQFTRSRLPRRRDGLLEAPSDHHASFVERLAVNGVEVTFEDPEHEDPADEDLETLGYPRYVDGAWPPLSESLTNALAARRRAPRWRIADICGPEGDDVPVEEAERGRRRRRLGGAGRGPGGGGGRGAAGREGPRRATQRPQDGETRAVATPPE